MLTDETVEENVTEEVVENATPVEDIMVEESITEETVAEAPVEEEQDCWQLLNHQQLRYIMLWILC